jgi:DNA-directed RNA polymerase beta' subunit
VNAILQKLSGAPLTKNSTPLMTLNTEKNSKNFYTSYSKLSEIRLITIGYATPSCIKKWAEKTLPNGKIYGEVLNANTLHYKTFKPQKGGLFCERIFGPLKNFECACGKSFKYKKNLLQKKTTQLSASSWSKPIIQEPASKAFSTMQSVFGNLGFYAKKRDFCEICDVEYTWSVIRRYQLGYIKLVSPIIHIWYLKGMPSYLSILLQMKRRSLESIVYCSKTPTIEYALKGPPIILDSAHIIATWKKLKNLRSARIERSFSETSLSEQSSIELQNLKSPMENLLISTSQASLQPKQEKRNNQMLEFDILKQSKLYKRRLIEAKLKTGKNIRKKQKASPPISTSSMCQRQVLPVRISSYSLTNMGKNIKNNLDWPHKNKNGSFLSAHSKEIKKTKNLKFFHWPLLQRDPIRPSHNGWIENVHSSSIDSFKKQCAIKKRSASINHPKKGYYFLTTVSPTIQLKIFNRVSSNRPYGPFLCAHQTSFMDQVWASGSHRLWECGVPPDHGVFIDERHITKDDFFIEASIKQYTETMLTNLLSPAQKTKLRYLKILSAKIHQQKNFVPFSSDISSVANNFSIESEEAIKASSIISDTTDARSAPSFRVPQGILKKISIRFYILLKLNLFSQRAIYRNFIDEAWKKTTESALKIALLRINKLLVNIYGRLAPRYPLGRSSTKKPNNITGLWPVTNGFKSRAAIFGKKSKASLVSLKHKNWRQNRRLLRGRPSFLNNKLLLNSTSNRVFIKEVGSARCIPTLQSSFFYFRKVKSVINKRLYSLKNTLSKLAKFLVIIKQHLIKYEKESILSNKISETHFVDCNSLSHLNLNWVYIKKINLEIKKRYALIKNIYIQNQQSLTLIKRMVLGKNEGERERTIQSRFARLSLFSKKTKIEQRLVELPQRSLDKNSGAPTSSADSKIFKNTNKKKAVKLPANLRMQKRIESLEKNQELLKNLCIILSRASLNEASHNIEQKDLNNASNDTLLRYKSTTPNQYDAPIKKTAPLDIKGESREKAEKSKLLSGAPLNNLDLVYTSKKKFYAFFELEGSNFFKDEWAHNTGSFGQSFAAHDVSSAQEKNVKNKKIGGAHVFYKGSKTKTKTKNKTYYLKKEKDLNDLYDLLQFSIKPDRKTFLERGFNLNNKQSSVHKRLEISPFIKGQSSNNTYKNYYCLKVGNNNLLRGDTQRPLDYEKNFEQSFAERSFATQFFFKSHLYLDIYTLSNFSRNFSNYQISKFLTNYYFKKTILKNKNGHIKTTHFYEANQPQGSTLWPIPNSKETSNHLAKRDLVIWSGAPLIKKLSRLFFKFILGRSSAQKNYLKMATVSKYKVFSFLKNMSAPNPNVRSSDKNGGAPTSSASIKKLRSMTLTSIKSPNQSHKANIMCGARGTSQNSIKKTRGFASQVHSYFDTWAFKNTDCWVGNKKVQSKLNTSKTKAFNPLNKLDRFFYANTAGNSKTVARLAPSHNLQKDTHVETAGIEDKISSNKKILPVKIEKWFIFSLENGRSSAPYFIKSLKYIFGASNHYFWRKRENSIVFIEGIDSSHLTKRWEISPFIKGKMSDELLTLFYRANLWSSQLFNSEPYKNQDLIELFNKIVNTYKNAVSTDTVDTTMLTEPAQRNLEILPRWVSDDTAGEKQKPNIWAQLEPIDENWSTNKRKSETNLWSNNKWERHSLNRAFIIGKSQRQKDGVGPAMLPRFGSVTHSNVNRKANRLHLKKLYNNFYSIFHRARWSSDISWNLFYLFMTSPCENNETIIPNYKKQLQPAVPWSDVSLNGNIQLNQISSTDFDIKNSVFFSGPGIVKELLNEFNINELYKIDYHNKILLAIENKKIADLKKNLFIQKKILNKKKWKKLKKLYKRRFFFVRKAKLVRTLFKKESYLQETILSFLPVLPPELRPIVKMGNQIASSDLNRLYQRVIYRNDRLKKFLKDPATSHSFEMKYAQRLLQEAVDNLIQNSNNGMSAEKDSRGRLLKSLSDNIKGKQGRFRQYLLGKRVDYSGRSVIVVGPRLKLHECGLPKEMALELYLPFLLKRILNENFARTVVGAKTLIKTNPSLTWELLREIMQTCPVLLNRAPTLHRLGIQAFQPKLIEGRAILLHPLVCSAFNADFDGDQMAVHVPITVEARAEAWKLMCSRNNILSPATGDPLAIPSQDMLLGCYYLTINLLNRKTLNTKEKKLSGSYFSNMENVLKAYELNILDLHSNIWLKWAEPHIIENGSDQEEPIEIRIDSYGNRKEISKKYQKTYNSKESFCTQYILTTPGKILFNKLIQKALQ